MANDLQTGDFFRLDLNMDADEKLAFLQNLENKSYTKGNAVVKCGDDGEDGLYIITSGKALVKNAEGKVINELKEGDYFGELALLIGEGRKATVEADGDLETVRMPKEVYTSLIAKNPKNQGYLFSNLYKNLSEKYDKICELTRIRQRYAQMFTVFFFYVFISVLLAVLGPQHVAISNIIKPISLIVLMIVAGVKAVDLGISKSMKGFLPTFAVAFVLFGLLAYIFTPDNLLIRLPVSATMVSSLPPSTYPWILLVLIPCIQAVNTVVLAGFTPNAISTILPKKNNTLNTVLFCGALSTIVPLITGVMGIAANNLFYTAAMAIGGFVAYSLTSLVFLKLKNGIGLIAGSALGCIAAGTLILLFPVA